MGFGAVFVSAFVVQVLAGGFSLGDGDEVVDVAAGRWGGAGGSGAGAVAEFDGDGEFAGGESAEFGGVQEVAVVVGEEPVEQGEASRVRCTLRYV